MDSLGTQLEDGMWDSLPVGLIGCIVGKLEGDFATISAVRQLSKHWREGSEWISTFRTSCSYRCKKHGSSSACSCCQISMANYISNVIGLRNLVLEDSANDLLAALDWTNLSRSLRRLYIDLGSTFVTEPQSLSNLLSNCRSLSQLGIMCRRPYFNLSYQLVERLRKLHLFGCIDWAWLVALPRLPCLEELILSCEKVKVLMVGAAGFTVTLNTPKLRTLTWVILSNVESVLEVEAPLVQRMYVSGITRLRVFGATELRSLTLGPGTTLVHGPPSLKKLIIEGYLKAFDPELLTTFDSLRAVPFITKLVILPVPFFCHPRSRATDSLMVNRFVNQIALLTQLEELEMNLYVIDLLMELGPLMEILPKLKTMTVNTYAPTPFTFKYIYGNASGEHAFGDRIVKILERFKCASMKIKKSRFCDSIVKAKVERYFD